MTARGEFSYVPVTDITDMYSQDLEKHKKLAEGALNLPQGSRAVATFGQEARLSKTENKSTS